MGKALLPEVVSLRLPNPAEESPGLSFTPAGESVSRAAELGTDA